MTETATPPPLTHEQIDQVLRRLERLAKSEELHVFNADEVAVLQTMIEEHRRREAMLRWLAKLPRHIKGVATWLTSIGALGFMVYELGKALKWW